jgi:Tol biopolymer transport system component
MKLLKTILFAIAVLASAASANAQSEDYWGRDLNVVLSGFHSTNPVWSPDGKWIAYLSHDSIYAVPAEGGDTIFFYVEKATFIEPEPHENCIKENLTRDMTISQICFTPDSREITFVAEIYDEEYGSSILIEGDERGTHDISLSDPVPQISSVDIFTGETRTFTDGTKPIFGLSPVWSNDGRYLCYSNWDYETNVNNQKTGANNLVTVFDTLTGEVRFLTDNQNRTPVRFSLDNSHVICREGYSTYYRIPLDGGEEELLTSVDCRENFSDISPDEMWALYPDSEKPYSLMVNNTLTGESLTLLYGDDKNSFEEAVFSADGALICYMRRSFESSRIEDSLYILDFNPFDDPDLPNAESPLAEEYGTKVDFSWSIENYEYAMSSDGELFAFSSPFSGSRIWTAPNKGGDIELVFTYPDTDDNKIYPSISDISFLPDSREIYFTCAFYDSTKGSIVGNVDYEVYNIESVDLNTGEHRIVIEGGMNPSWSNDGRYLVYINFDYMINVDPSRAVRNGVVSIYDSVTGVTRYLADGEESAWIWSTTDNYKRKTGAVYKYPMMSPEGSHIICERYGYPAVYEFSLESGEPEFLIMDNRNILHPQYSPDGKWILFMKRNKSAVLRIYLYNIELEQFFEMVDESCDPRIFEMGECAVWSGDGSKIYYSLMDMSDEYQIYSIDFDSGDYMNIVHTGKENIGSFTLLNNYPNPFNPSTTIPFSLAESGKVTLKIYSITGQRVGNVIDGVFPAGHHEAIFRAEHLPSGMYFYRIEMGGFRETKSMLLLK